jgi:predicted transposase YbfD/YdcC
VKQVAKVIRTRTVRHWKGDGRTRKLVTGTTTETVYLVTSLTSADASPRQIAAYIRAHRGIEDRTHWVRDTTLREDACKVRHPPAPATSLLSATSPSDSSTSQA